MAVHDYWCQHCGQVLTDVNIPVAIGATAGAPFCPNACRAGEPQRLPVRMTAIPGIGSMDVGGTKGAAFRAFDTFDGRNQPVRIDSLRKLRQVERESEQHARNGEGQPMIFRRWSQDGSNRDQHTLHPSYDGGEHPTEEAKHRFGQTLRKSTEEPEVGFGPGVSESNASALPMEGAEK